MTKEKEYVCILDCYFELMPKSKGSYYKISDKELNKLIVSYRVLENEMNFVKHQTSYYMDRQCKRISELKRKNHVYKIELGRCVRKLTRIYEKQLQVAVLAYALGKLDMKPHEYVDTWRQV